MAMAEGYKRYAVSPHRYFSGFAMLMDQLHQEKVVLNRQDDGEDINAPEADAELARMLRQAKNLDSRERGLLDDMMKSLLKRRQET
jgi:hypothetical protein